MRPTFAFLSILHPPVKSFESRIYRAYSYFLYPLCSGHVTFCQSDNESVHKNSQPRATVSARRVYGGFWLNNESYCKFYGQCITHYPPTFCESHTFSFSCKTGLVHMNSFSCETECMTANLSGLQMSNKMVDRRRRWADKNICGRQEANDEFRCVGGNTFYSPRSSLEGGSEGK